MSNACVSVLCLIDNRCRKKVAAHMVRDLERETRFKYADNFAEKRHLHKIAKNLEARRIYLLYSRLEGQKTRTSKAAEDGTDLRGFRFWWSFRVSSFHVLQYC